MTIVRRTSSLVKPSNRKSMRNPFKTTRPARPVPLDLHQSLRRTMWIGTLALGCIVLTFVALMVVEDRTDARLRLSDEILTQARAAQALVVARQAIARGYLLEADTVVLARERLARIELRRRLDSLMTLTAPNPAHHAHVARVVAAITAWELGSLAPTLAAGAQRRPPVARDRELMADVRDAFGDLVDSENALYVERAAQTRAVRRIGLVSLLAEVLVLALVLGVLARRLAHQADEMMESERQLQEQAAELEHQTQEAQELAQDLEISNEELSDALDVVRAAAEAERAAVEEKSRALAQLDAALGGAPIAFAFYDRDLRYVRVNPALAALTGLPVEAHRGRRIRDVLPALAPIVEPILDRVISTGKPVLDVEVEGPTPTSPERRRSFLASYYPISDNGGGLSGVGAVIVDTTEQKHLQEQLRQSQKMEAVGQLAGGIAHDFNNMLTAIKSFSELLLSDMPDDGQHRGDVVEIRSAADRAAALTRQLLAFSRRQLLQPVQLDINQVVRGLEDMLGRLLGEDIDCVWRLDPALDLAIADPSQIDQILLNLAVNARDAMPKGGRLTIETANVWIDQEYADRVGDVPAGRYVVLAVSDTGIGMDAETRGRIFEPFFTTKEPGRGTGLGLSTVYGIVRQSDGHISVYSEPERGTTFRIYLPRSEALSRRVTPARLVTRPAPTGSETVLLVEDDPAVRLVAARILGRQGYRVFEAPTPEEALSIVDRHAGAIDLIMTDLVLPQMSGRELAERVLETAPEIKVLFMSGYTDDAVIRRGLLEPGMAFLGKPFTVDEMARTVRRALDGTPAGRP